MAQKYDAILLVSFGGPEKMDDVMPFLENVVRGRNVPRERLLEVAEHYAHFGGVSPINAQNRRLIESLRIELAAQGIDLPIYFGNRNWHPMLPDEMRRMKADGVRRALAFVTAAYSSYSSCRQYIQNIDDARSQVEGAPEVDKIRVFFNHPLFIQAQIQQVSAALEKIPAPRRAEARILFTAHSIPSSMASGCGYEAQLLETARLVATALGRSAQGDAGRWAMVYQSRSGPPQVPWLEPDVGDVLKTLAAEGSAKDVVIAPIGFLSDHIEVLFDLDTEAAEIAAHLGLNMVRAATVGTHPLFVRMIGQLIAERLDPTIDRAAEGCLAMGLDICPPDCCPPPAARPARPPEPGRADAAHRPG